MGALKPFAAAGIDRDNLTCGDVYAYFQYCLLKKLPTVTQGKMEFSILLNDF